MRGVMHPLSPLQLRAHQIELDLAVRPIRLSLQFARNTIVRRRYVQCMHCKADAAQSCAFQILGQRNPLARIRFILGADMGSYGTRPLDVTGKQGAPHTLPISHTDESHPRAVVTDFLESIEHLERFVRAAACIEGARHGDMCQGNEIRDHRFSNVVMVPRKNAFH